MTLSDEVHPTARTFDLPPNRWAPLLLHRHGFILSMNGKGNCYDNAMVETLFNTIKSELIWRTKFQSRCQAEHAITRYIDGFYNPVYPHPVLGCKSH